MNTKNEKKLIKGTDVIGLKVISVREGRELHSVKDIIYDPDLNKVSALLIDSGGWFSDARVVLIEDVKSIGDDAVILESENYIKPASEISERISSIARDNVSLTKTRIITDKGQDLGTIIDIFFDESGAVEEFEVSEGVLKTLQSGQKRIHVRDIITIGEDATIVRDTTEEKLEEQGKQQGIQGAVNKIGQTASDLADKTKRKADKLTGKTKQKMEDVKQDERTKEFLDSAKQQGEEWRDKFKTVASNAKESAEDTKENAQDEWKEWKSGDTLTRARYKQDEFVRRVDGISQKAKDKTEDIRDVLSRAIDKATIGPGSDDYQHQEQYGQHQSGLKGGKTRTLSSRRTRKISSKQN